jgi:hypothetical protein
MVSGGSAGVEYAPHYRKVTGLSSAIVNGRGRENDICKLGLTFITAKSIVIYFLMLETL